MNLGVSRSRLGAAIGLACALAATARAAPCRYEAEWRVPADIARVPGVLEAVAALALWGPTARDDWEGAIARADAGQVTTTIRIDGRRVRLGLEGATAGACALAEALASERRSARWEAEALARARALPLVPLAPSSALREEALVARAALGVGPIAPWPEAIATPWPDAVGAEGGRPGRRTEDPPPETDGRARLAIAWPIAPGELGLAAAAAADLTHPGGPLASRLTGSHGAADRVTARVVTLPPTLVLLAVTGDTKAARDRVLRELESYEIDPRPAALQAFADASDAARLERFVRRLARAPASEIVQAAPEGASTALADADDVMLFLRASIDLRCPAPGETRSTTELLEDKHGLDAQRYLALSRALGRDPERFQGIDLEIRDRCAERAKLARLMAPGRVVSLYRAVRCLGGADPRARARAEAALFRRYDLDPSALGPLVALVREEPRWTRAVLDVERQCPAEGDAAPGGGTP